MILWNMELSLEDDPESILPISAEKIPKYLVFPWENIHRSVHGFHQGIRFCRTVLAS